MQTKVRVSVDEKRYVSFNLGEIQFKNPNGKYIFTRLEYLELKKEKILANTKEFETLFNDIIDRFNWNTDEFCYYLKGEVFWWNGFYYMFELLNDIFKKRGIHHKLKFIDNNPSLKFKEPNNYVGYPYMLGIPFYEPNEDIIFDNRKIDKNFLCLNRRVKPFREQIVEIIHDYNLFDKFHYSFGVDGESRNHPFYKKIDTILRSEFNPITGLEKSTFCLLITENSVEYVDRIHDLNVDKAIHLNGNLINHLTEKTTRALCLGMPFIVVSSPFSLKTLRDHGFKTFGDFWNEDYDEHIHWEDRFEKIKKLIIEISNFSLDKCNELYKQMIPILEHNRNRYLELNKEWSENIKMENVIDYDFEKENEYYEFFERMRFQENKTPLV